MREMRNEYVMTLQSAPHGARRRLLGIDRRLARAERQLDRIERQINCMKHRLQLARHRRNQIEAPGRRAPRPFAP